KVYTFPHRTFQEYLAACHLTDDEYPDQVADLVKQAPNRWREVTLLAGAKATQGGAFAIWPLIEALCSSAPPEIGSGRSPDRAGSLADLWSAHIAGQALVETANLDQLSNSNRRKVDRVRHWLAYLLTDDRLPVTERAAAGRSLAHLGDPREDVMCVVPTMIEIPAGPFLMGSDKEKDKQAGNNEMRQQEVILPACKIGKYPVTNWQFKQFVEADGYENADYWTAAGWQRRQQEKWTEPRDWHDPLWNLENHPVVGISWYEAVAYCTWLKATSRRDFRLPDEAMWEKAARGVDGRIYPWGNVWDENKLNAHETGLNRTSVVGMFAAGQSDYGIYGLSGNVDEWVSSKQKRYPFKIVSYDQEITGTNPRGLRGGAFDDTQRITRAAFRSSGFPHGRNSNVGFRVAEHL
ncbi:MAG: formylglycine-generating enzyme family protein, partial [Chloroflexi bacterium]|nr:formylglycine-generating enzyme family protein [Chloroflexota bacterium]